MFRTLAILLIAQAGAIKLADDALDTAAGAGTDTALQTGTDETGANETGAATESGESGAATEGGEISGAATEGD